MFRDRDRRFGRTRPDHPAIEYAAADFSGHYIPGRRIRVGPCRKPRRFYCEDESVVPEAVGDRIPLLDRVLVWLIDQLPEWERSRNLTPDQSQFLRQLIFSGWTQEAVAEHEAMGTDDPIPSKQAISSRLYGRTAPGGGKWGGIVKKVPEAIEAWKFIQRCCAHNQERAQGERTQNELADDI